MTDGLTDGRTEVITIPPSLFFSLGDKKCVCLSYLNFSDPLSETRFFCLFFGLFSNSAICQ